MVSHCFHLGEYDGLKDDIVVQGMFLIYDIIFIITNIIISASQLTEYIALKFWSIGLSTVCS